MNQKKINIINTICILLICLLIGLLINKLWNTNEKFRKKGDCPKDCLKRNSENTEWICGC